MERALGDGLLMVLLVYLGGFLAVVTLIVWLLAMGRGQESDGHGFEVKRTTGQLPVLMKERENDHG